MNPFFRSAVWTIALCLPAIAVYAYLFAFKRKHVREARKPFTSLPVRVAGESTREKADEYFESATGDMLVLTFLPGIGLVYGLVLGWRLNVVLVVLFATFLGFSAWLGLRIRKKVLSCWKYRLGALGEQVIARELDRLMAQGYRVFHDVPFETWNIDHVVVGLNGVFAVETKTWRKPPKESSLKSEIVFDGESLTRPGRQPDRQPIDQARQNAQSLAKWISLSAAENVPVTPVVALPGWFLRIDRYGAVAVYSGPNIADNMVKRGKGELQPEQVQRIAFQLGKLCETELREGARN